MSFPRALVLLGALAPSALAQSLQCPAPPAGRPCEGYHYHVQMYRPDTRAFFDFHAGAPFATEAACNRARERQVAANQKVVDFMRANRDQKYEADRVGGCHCDMTGDRASVTYLSEAQRVAQLRMAEEVRLRVRERLLDRKAASDSEAVLALWEDPPSTPSLGAPKVVPLPAAAPVAVATSVDDLQPTRTLDMPRPAVAAMDLPLVEIGGTPAEVAAAPAAPAPAPAAETPAARSVEMPATVVETKVEARVEAVVEERVEPQPEVIDIPADVQLDAEEDESPVLIAERFVSYETERIQNVLRASAAIGDEQVKTRIFEAAMERIQLLSNLRLLIERSGARSRLATAAHDAQSEPERLALVGRLFGDLVRSHWAPQDAAEIAFRPDGDVAAAPERVLRDASGEFTAEQRKQALYLLLAQTQPDEEQRSWLTTVVEGFLR